MAGLLESWRGRERGEKDVMMNDYHVCSSCFFRLLFCSYYW
jgi:hypothetical protein